MLEKEHCNYTQLGDYTINTYTLQTAIKKLQNRKYPRNDLIVGYWYKNLTFYRNDLAELYDNNISGPTEIQPGSKNLRFFFFLKIPN